MVSLIQHILIKIMISCRRMVFRVFLKKTADKLISIKSKVIYSWNYYLYLYAVTLIKLYSFIITCTTVLNTPLNLKLEGYFNSCLVSFLYIHCKHFLHPLVLVITIIYYCFQNLIHSIINMRTFLDY